MAPISVCHGVEKQIMTLSILGEIGESAPGCVCRMMMTVGTQSEMRWLLQFWLAMLPSHFNSFTSMLME